MTRTEWKVEADGKGAFNACFEEFINGESHGKGVALSGLTLDRAVDHVAFASRSDAEREAQRKLVDGLFDSQNWKMPTNRVVVTDAGVAKAVKDALAYFCGGAEIFNTPDGKFSVGSAGYYHYVGA